MALIANLINVYIAHLYTSKDYAYREWLLQVIKEVYEKFEEKFLALFKAQKESALITPGFIDDSTLESYQKEFMHQIFCQSIGFAGCKMARRVFGIAGVEEIRGIKDATIRKQTTLHALKLGVSLIENYEHIDDIYQLLSIIEEEV